MYAVKALRKTGCARIRELCVSSIPNNVTGENQPIAGRQVISVFDSISLPTDAAKTDQDIRAREVQAR